MPADAYDRERIEHPRLEGDVIPAYLFTPRGRVPIGGVVVFHQHNGEFHFGKSEVAGLMGREFQAFGTALARRGLVVLAPDTIPFEDRRAGVSGVEPDTYDWLRACPRFCVNGPKAGNCRQAWRHDEQAQP